MSDEQVVSTTDAPTSLQDATKTIAQSAPPTDSLAVRNPDKRYIADRDQMNNRDVLADVLKDPTKQAYVSPSNQSRTYEPVDVNPQVTSTATSSAAPVISTSTAPVTQDPVRVETPVEKKLYAGKFETIEEFEKSYKEAEKFAHTKAQEAAELKKKLEQPAPVETPEQIAAKKAEALEKILNDPDSVLRDAKQAAADLIKDEQKRAQELNRITADWESQNKDLIPHKEFVGIIVQSLILQDPDKYGDDPAAALAQAGVKFRNVYGTIREEGKKEALSVQSSVTPLGSSTLQTRPPTEQPAKAPMTQEQAYQETMAMLNKNAASVRRTR